MLCNFCCNCANENAYLCFFFLFSFLLHIILAKFWTRPIGSTQMLLYKRIFAYFYTKSWWDRIYFFTCKTSFVLRWWNNLNDESAASYTCHSDFVYRTSFLIIVVWIVTHNFNTTRGTLAVFFFSSIHSRNSKLV